MFQIIKIKLDLRVPEKRRALVWRKSASGVSQKVVEGSSLEVLRTRLTEEVTGEKGTV